MSEQSPLMKQYLEIKNRYRDAILFFRLGDFYEMFYEDAQTASKILEITLTTRDKKKEEAVPLCGVPYHAASSYIAKLIRAGWKVAICEQLEDPKHSGQSSARGLVRREVVRVITPGTVIETDLLEATQPRYIAAICPSDSAQKSSGKNQEPSRKLGLAYLDLSTGEFRITEFADRYNSSRLEHELACLDPKELLLPSRMQADSEHPMEDSLRVPLGEWLIQYLPDWHFTPDLATQLLCSHFGVRTLDGYGCNGRLAATAAAGALLRYVSENQKGSLKNITTLRWQSLEDYMVLDSQTQRNLELTRRTSEYLTDSKQDATQFTLLGILDRTQTPMGARLLREWLLRPLLDLSGINARLAVVEGLIENYGLRVELRSALSRIHDLERLVGRISLGTSNPRDLVTLKNSLKGLPDIQKLLGSSEVPRVQELILSWDNLVDLYQIIETSIQDDPPAHLREAHLIKEGISTELDELRSISRDGKGWIARLEAQERERTGIESLKIRYNQVFGYYIEITKSNLHLVPTHYHRKQTLVNAERFITPELKSLEEKVLGADGQIIDLEYKLFEEVRLQAAGEASRIQAMARLLAHLDALAALAEVAHTNHYVRPQVTTSQDIRIIDGRHPVLERITATESFVPNDTLLDGEENRLLVITGPNMAGKSTYMRQVALTVLMAQMGSFVPASEATIGLVDRIFTRVGAMDDLARGRSTFMVEMNETANIVNNATPQSLIIMDEIGRGTSTFDGISIAWAVAEHLLTRIGARTLFATHYHELTDLAAHHPGIKNLKAAIREWNEEIVFLRKIVEGGADQSYGIQVARLAGLPVEVLQRAKEVLANLEPHLTRVAPPDPDRPAAQPNLFESTPSARLLEEITHLDILKLNPLEALHKLDDLKKRIQALKEST